PHIVPGVKGVHRGLAAVGNALEQHFVRSRLKSDDTLACCGVDGDDVMHDRLPMSPLGNGASLGKVLTALGFGTSARRPKNGFIGAENCFVAAGATKHSWQKCEYSQYGTDWGRGPQAVPASQAFSPVGENR